MGKAKAVHPVAMTTPLHPKLLARDDLPGGIVVGTLLWERHGVDRSSGMAETMAWQEKPYESFGSVYCEHGLARTQHDAMVAKYRAALPVAAEADHG